MRRALAFLLLIAAGCSSPVKVDILPTDVRWVGFVELGEKDRVVSSTGLMRIEPSDTPDLPDSDGGNTVAVLGFSDEAIGALAPPADRIEVDALYAASDCEATLPTPSFSTSYVDGTQTTATLELPPLTAAWRVGGCPVPETDDITIDDTCVRGQCKPPIEIDRCCVVLRMADCGLDDIRMTIEPHGALTYLDGGNAECRTSPSPEGAAGTFMCSEPLACRADVYTSLDEQPLTIDRLRLFDVPTLDTIPDDTNSLRSNNVFDGYLTELLVFDDHLVVSTFGGEFRNHLCMDTSRAELIFVDPDAFEIQARVLAPACTSHLAKDPRGGDAFFGVTAISPNLALVAFHASGAVTASVAVPYDPIADEGLLTISELFVGGDPPQIYVVADAARRRESIIVRFDLDLGYLGTSEILSREIVAIHALAPPELLIVDDGQDELVWLDTSDQTITHAVPVTFGGASHLIDAYPLDDRMLATVSGQFGAVHLARKGEPPVRAKPFLYEASITSAAPWDGATWLVALTRHREADFAAAFALFDTTRPRFLGSRVQLDRGAVFQMRARRPREAFALMNWSAELVRIRAQN